jgi:hypothetical protein
MKVDPKLYTLCDPSCEERLPGLALRDDRKDPYAKDR